MPSRWPPRRNSTAGRTRSFAPDRAITTLVENKQRFGEGAQDIAGLAVRYLRSLPTRDRDPIGSADVTTEPTEARFVEVAARPAAFRSLFAGAAGVDSRPADVASRAVGGFDSLACKTSPLFICNPFERSATNLFSAMRDPANRRRLIRMKEKETKYFPGNFGYLQPAAGGGAEAVRDAIGAAEPKGCYKQSGVELRTGAIASTAEAMNTRFDIYDGHFKSAANDPDFRPALNVRKGFASKNADCPSQALAYDPSLSPQGNMTAGAVAALGLPRDDCFYTNSCTFGGAALQGRVGNGKWDIERYWNVTYATSPPNGWSNADPPSRYEVYRYEIDNKLRLEKAKGFNNPIPTSTEVGAPVCSVSRCPLRTRSSSTAGCSSAPSSTARLSTRRTASAAAPPHRCRSRRSANSSSPSLFDKHDGAIWVEMIDLVEPGTARARGIVHDVVRLYR